MLASTGRGGRARRAQSPAVHRRRRLSRSSVRTPAAASAARVGLCDMKNGTHGKSHRAYNLAYVSLRLRARALCVPAGGLLLLLWVRRLRVSALMGYIVGRCGGSVVGLSRTITGDQRRGFMLIRRRRRRLGHRLFTRPPPTTTTPTPVMVLHRFCVYFQRAKPAALLPASAASVLSSLAMLNIDTDLNKCERKLVCTDDDGGGGGNGAYNYIFNQRSRRRRRGRCRLQSSDVLGVAVERNNRLVANSAVFFMLYPD